MGICSEEKSNTIFSKNNDSQGDIKKDKEKSNIKS